ncbi:TPR domain containing protein [Plasmodium gonderi]|uniref:TPR domain containing protein n=1 Tax=Plasmodium gonderi TaxID=77519 RepID=A0A1Y1JV50_PLAGO|nr:TPR domain containing protein [Plasmodium gonderi]GAW83784.1 TPR domain containing protein [Plasmodium gonderi]
MLLYAFTLFISIIGTWIYLKIVENRKKKKNYLLLEKDDLASINKQDEKNCDSVSSEKKNIFKRKFVKMENSIPFYDHPHGSCLDVASRNHGTDSIKLVTSEKKINSDTLAGMTFEVDSTLHMSSNHVDEQTKRESPIGLEFDSPPGESLEETPKMRIEESTEKNLLMDESQTEETRADESSLERIAHYSEKEKFQMTEENVSYNSCSLINASSENVKNGSNDREVVQDVEEGDIRQKENNTFNKMTSYTCGMKYMEEEVKQSESHVEKNMNNKVDNHKTKTNQLDDVSKSSYLFIKEKKSNTKGESTNEKVDKEEMNTHLRNYYSDNCLTKEDNQNSSSYLSSSREADNSENTSYNDYESGRSDDSASGRSSSVMSDNSPSSKLGDDDDDEVDDDEMDDDEMDDDEVDDDEMDDDEMDDDDVDDDDEEDNNGYRDGGTFYRERKGSMMNSEIKNKSVEEIKESGNEYFKKGEYTKAIFYYNNALKKCKEKNIKSILYSNRAACNLCLKKWNEVVEDCNKSINCNENYVKSYIRRSNAYEQLEKYNNASNDLNKAISMDSSLLANYEMKQKKLKILAEQQLNKEKEEMVGKLKDFGNLLLGKVGLSLDNFEVQKNPNNDGSFNIQFKQNK